MKPPEIITERESAWLAMDAYVTPLPEHYGDDGYVHFKPTDCEILHHAEQLTFIDVDDCEAYVGRLGSVGFVAVRGTSSLADVDKDRKFALVPFRVKPDPSVRREYSFDGKGFVARGDLEFATNIIAPVLEALAKLDVVKVLLVGHSLAGGVIQVLAPMIAIQVKPQSVQQAIQNAAYRYDVYLNGFNPKRALSRLAAGYVEHTLEPPKSVDGMPTKYRITWFQNSIDAVPHMPPIFLGYRHPRGRRYLTRKGEWRESIPIHYIVIGFLIGTVYSFVKTMGKAQLGKHMMEPFAKKIAARVEAEEAKRGSANYYVRIPTTE